MRSALLALLACLPAAVFAAGGGDNSPPKTTKTTSECAEGTVWDEQAQACVAPKESSLDDDGLYRTVRELAYAGRYDTALDAIAAMSDPEDDRALTYLGFIHRKIGDADTSMAYYQEALARNPDNLLARSYMGQAFVEVGEIDLARIQLREIRARGGRMTWPDVSLEQAIRTGRGALY